MAKVHDLLDRWRRMEQRKAPWLELWQDLAELYLPNSAKFTENKFPGEEVTDNTYDSQPRIAARALTKTVGGLLMPQTKQWFKIRSSDDVVNEDPEVKRWLDFVQERMWNAMYRPSARFKSATAECEEAVTIFGAGPLWMGERRDFSGLAFRSFHLSRVGIGEDSDGNIDKFSVWDELTYGQARDRYGEDNLAPKMKQDAARPDQKNAEKRFKFVELILPRDDVDASAITVKRMPYVAAVLDVDHEHIVDEKGYEEFPVAFPRWDTMPGECFGRSPAMLALPDARMLQSMAKTLIIGGQKAVDPPIWAYGDAAVSPVRTWAGGLTILDGSMAEKTGGQPIGALDLGKNLPLGQEMQTETREQVKAAFFQDLLSMPADDRVRTATEILKREEQMLRIIGPTFAQLETDYAGVIVERVFKIMERNGAFPDPPEAIVEAGGDLRFEFASPIQQAKKKTEALGLAEAFETLGPLAQAQPEMLDNLDGDEIARDLPDFAGIPQQWLRDQDQVEQLRAQRQQATETAQTASVAREGAAAVKDLAAAGGGRGNP